MFYLRSLELFLVGHPPIKKLLSDTQGLNLKEINLHKHSTFYSDELCGLLNILIMFLMELFTHSN